jgi:type I restriction enzyme, R subunit
VSKIQWEYDLVERPFCEQLKTMGWSWTPGDVDVLELTERESFREVLLAGRLAAALAPIYDGIRQVYLYMAQFRDAGMSLDEGREKLVAINESRK